MRINKLLKKMLMIVLVLVMFAPVMDNLEADLKEVQAAETSLSDVLSVKCQVTDGVVTETSIDKYRNNYVMRFVSSVDNLNYREVGFKISYEENGKTVTKTNKTSTVFRRIESTTGSTESEKDTYKFSPKVISPESEYLITAKLPIAPENKDVEYTVWAFAKTSTGQTIEGPKRCVSANDGLKDCKTINISFENTGNQTVKVKDVLTVDGYEGASATVIGVNGTMVHTRITGVDKGTLKSATKFVFKSGDVTVGSGIFRNLYTVYEGTADTSWYEVYSKEDANERKFIIATVADFYGFASIVDGGNDLNGKEIYVTSNLVVNKEELITDSADENYLKWKNQSGEYVAQPKYTWDSIGSNTASENSKLFAGTFDGQGHTISGIYCKNSATYTGLFTKTQSGAVIQDFRLEDSYFESSQAYTGSIVGSFTGAIEKVYSNAIIKRTGGSRYGGIVGTIGGTALIKECWFDGNIDASSGSYVGGITGCIETGTNPDTNKVSIEHCLYTGHLTASNEAGGICGYTLYTGDARIYDCLSVGTANYSGSYVGCFVGWVVDEVTIENSVGNTSFRGYRYNASTENDKNAHMTNVPTAINSADYKGVAAATLDAYLDFEHYWILKNGRTPELQSLSGSFFDSKWVNSEGKTVYEIENSEELQDFALASQVNSFENCIVKLDADVVLNAGTATADGWSGNDAVVNWTPIGNAAHPFAGTFDGQGHTISGACFKQNVQNAGLFSKTAQTACIKDFRLENSYFESNEPFLGSVVGSFAGTAEKIYSNAIVNHTGSRSRIGGIVGTIQGGTATISECWFAGKVFTVSATYVGGITGGIEAGDNNDVLIKHCLYTGHVKASNEAGGIAGYMLSGNNVKVEDSLSVGTAEYTSSVVGSLVGFVGDNITVENSVGNLAFNTNRFEYNDKSKLTMINVSSAIDNSNYIGAKAVGLNQYLDFDNAWLPQPSGTPVLQCFANEFYKDYEIDSNNNLVYTIDSVDEFYEFAAISQTEDFVNCTVKLGADITLNAGTATENGWSGNATPKNWTPIGNASKPFAGTFDGQGHTISGVYLVDNTYEAGLGLFSKTTAQARIENFRLENSYFESDSPFLGAVVGSFAGTAEKIYSNAFVNHTGARSRIGGIVGTIQGGAATLSECWFEGKVLASKATYVGGITGGIEAGDNDVLIESCLYNGHVTASNEAGGICGHMLSGGNVKITDSVSVGTATYSSNYVGCYVGWIEDHITIENCVGNKVFHTYRVNYSNANSDKISWVNVGDAIDNANSIGNVGLSLDTYLDFESTWVLHPTKTPMLKYFTTGVFKNFGLDNNRITYTIQSVEDLNEFADMTHKVAFADYTIKLGKDLVLNEGTATVNGFTGNAEVTNWKPMGDATYPFAGTFDGQGYTISGLNCTVNGTYAGLFAKTATTAVLKDFRLENSYITSNYHYAGTIVGSFYGTVERVYSNAILANTGTPKYYGGIAGIALNGTITESWYNGTIKAASVENVGGIVGFVEGGTVGIDHCLFTGKISAKNYASGLCGYVYSAATFTINDSLSMGELDSSFAGTRAASMIGDIKAGTVTITNTVGNEKFKENRLYTGGGTATYTTALGTTQAACVGAAGASLKSHLDFENYWALRENDVPVLQYFSDDFQGDYVIENGKKVYTINNKEDLYEFVEASQIRSFANSVVKLGADITVNEGKATVNGWTENENPEKWTPIGKSKAFAGTFDGQGHTISGVYAEAGEGYGYMGLFASTSDTSIVQNLFLKNSYFNVADINRVGSIAGSGAGKFYNLYSDAIVISNNQWFGGIVGFATNTELERCWFDGTVISTTNNADHMGKGGLIGIQYGGTASVKNCLNTGLVDVSAYNAVTSGSTSVSPRAGGLVGYVTSGGTMSIDSSLNIGKIKLHKDVNHGYGRIVGHKSADCSVMISNSYATTNAWTGDDPIQTTVSYEIVGEDDIKGASAKNAMPLLDWSAWTCDEMGNGFPTIEFSVTNVGQKANYAVTVDDVLLLTNLYKEWSVYHGDIHAHADDDAREDETTALAERKAELANQNVDFAASLDHKQTNHIANSEWDKNVFLYGTEASTTISDILGSGSKELHYNMLFNTEENMKAVLNAFKGTYGYSGGTTYAYGDFNKASFGNVIAKVKEEGGLFVIPHPAQEHTYNLIMKAPFSKNIDDYYFGQDFIGFEVVYGSLSEELTKQNYKLWKEMLAKGYKYWATSGSDIHGSRTPDGNTDLGQKALTSVYADVASYTTKSEAYMAQLTTGNFTAGSVGIKMCIGDTPMGSECDFSGKRLVVEIGEFHEYVNKTGRKYHVDIVTDKGVIYSQPITLEQIGTDEAYIALIADAQYKFYRVEVVDENDVRRIAYGNPIWNTNVVTK